MVVAGVFVGMGVELVLMPVGVSVDQIMRFKKCVICQYHFGAAIFHYFLVLAHDYDAVRYLRNYMDILCRSNDGAAFPSKSLNSVYEMPGSPGVKA